MSDQLFVQDNFVRFFAAIHPLPNVLRQVSYFRQQLVFTKLVNGRVDQDPAHPPHQYFFQFLQPGTLKPVKILEDFYKSIVDYVPRPVIVVDIPENDFQTIPIESFIELLLALLVIIDTSFYYGVKISQMLIAGFGFWKYIRGFVFPVALLLKISLKVTKSLYKAFA